MCGVIFKQLEKELFSFLTGKPHSHNPTKEEWKAMPNPVEDLSVIIKPADKDSCVVISDREDYLAEGYRQLSDHLTYNNVKRIDLIRKSNKIFKGLSNKKLITEKELKYFSFSFKNACRIEKMYLLPKILKRLFDVPGRPIISDCRTPTKKVSGFLDFHLQPVMKGGRSYVKETQYFLEKLKHLGKDASNSILVTADVVLLYLSIPHEPGLETLYEKLEERVEQKIPSSDLVNMAELVLKNNYFEFDSKVNKQIPVATIGTIYAPPYACIFMDMLEREVFEADDVKPWVWLRYIDNIFFYLNRTRK